jgi:hypothetical protein
MGPIAPGAQALRYVLRYVRQTTARNSMENLQLEYESIPDLIVCCHLISCMVPTHLLMRTL